YRLLFLILSACFTFFAAGFSETYTALQGGGLFLATLASIKSRNLSVKRILPFLVAGSVGAMLAAVILICAPGNEARIAEESVSGLLSPPSRHWFSLIKLSVHFGLDSVMFAVFKSWPTVASTLVLPAFLAFKLHGEGKESSAPSKSTSKQLGKWLVFTPIAGLMLIVFCFVPTAYVSAYLRGSYYPPARLFVTSQFVFISLACLVGYLAGMALKEALSTSELRNSRNWLCLFGIVSLLFLVVPFNSARSTWA